MEYIERALIELANMLVGLLEKLTDHRFLMFAAGAVATVAMVLLNRAGIGWCIATLVVAFGLACASVNNTPDPRY